MQKNGEGDNPRPAGTGVGVVEREPGIKPSASSPVAPATTSATAPDAGKPVTKLKPSPVVTSTKPVTTGGPKPTGVATGLTLDPKGP
ncbi:hypothetical protein D3C83_94780 [compost metagenome]